MLRYSPRLKPRARILRTHATDSEQLLWSRLRRKQILGIQFYRQKPLGEYIVDFYAPSVRLVIEVDGSQHLEAAQVAYDAQRTAYLVSEGLQVLRFTSHEVMRELESVIEEISRIVRETIGVES